MKRLSGWLKTASVLTALAFTSTTSATTGYFTVGYGAKSMGMVGATVSNPQDTIAAATNPAGMARIGERLDFGVRFFSPIREAELSTSALPSPAPITYDVDDKSRRDLFIIPNGGFNNRINDKLWFGMSMYGNGGMNATYDRNLYNEAASAMAAATGRVPDPDGSPGDTLPPFSPPEGFAFPLPDTGTLGVDLAQAVFAPTLSMNVNKKHSVGVSLLVGVQRFSARGLGNFQCFTQTGNSDDGASCKASGGAVSATPSGGLTNNGNDWSYGAGVRVGWLGEVHPRLTVGVAAASKIYMTEFDDYDELFAEDGDFDTPANFSVGLTFKATPELDLSFDYQRILYEGVNSISNAGPALGPSLGGGDLLGTDDGLGFGWEDINIYRLAANYRYGSNWTFRAGYSWNDQPIPESEVLFNILAPAVIENHATVGFTFRPDDSSEWNFAYMHAFEEDVSTNQSAFGVPGRIEMYQDSVDLSYSRMF